MCAEVKIANEAIHRPCRRKGKGVTMGSKNWKWMFALWAVFVAIAAFTSATSSARSDDEQEGKVKQAVAQSAKAAKAFDAVMDAPDKGIPRDLLARAKAIAVFPQVIKAAFVVGGEGGRGCVSRRTDAGWSDPVFFRAGGGSVGPQVGVSATDFVLLFMNDEAVSGLMKDKFELGADAGIAGGPVGREAGAGTDALMSAKILSYSRSHGLFAGVNLKGVVIRPEDDLNYAVYSKAARALMGEDAHAGGGTAEGLSAFTEAVARYDKTSDTEH